MISKHRFYSMWILAGIILLIWILYGCMGGKYNSPTSIGITKNYIEVDMSKDEVWKKLLQCSTEDFFVVNNIEKDSGFMNVSYSVDNPSRLVDCGTMKSNLDGKIYPLADSFELRNGSEIWTTSCEGRINILVTEINSKTRIKANVRYIFEGSYYGYEPFGGARINYSDKMTFDSTDAGFMKGPPGINIMSCVPIDSLESRIFNCIK